MKKELLATAQILTAIENDNKICLVTTGGIFTGKPRFQVLGKDEGKSRDLSESMVTLNDVTLVTNGNKYQFNEINIFIDHIIGITVTE